MCLLIWLSSFEYRTFGYGLWLDTIKRTFILTNTSPFPVAEGKEDGRVRRAPMQPALRPELMSIWPPKATRTSRPQHVHCARGASRDRARFYVESNDKLVLIRNFRLLLLFVVIYPNYLILVTI